MLVTGVSGSTVFVNDPGYSTTSYTLSQIVEGNTGSYRVSNGFDILHTLMQDIKSIGQKKDIANKLIHLTE